MKFSTDGLVLKSSDVGESDRIITVLTKEYGIVRAFSNGAKKLRSPKQGATQPLCYSHFTFFQGRDSNTVADAQSIETFFRLRDDIEKLSLAQYFCELSGLLAPEETPAEEYLRLLLNALYLLTTGKRPQPFLKAVMELRLVSISGYMPDLVGCAKCGAYTDDEMYFDRREGCLYCSGCADHGEPLTMGVLAAMRHICFSEPEKVFSFTLSDDGLRRLANLTQGYMHAHLNHTFKTLQFYNQIKT